MSAVDVVPLSADNPLGSVSPLPFELPPFAGISAEHCREALLAGVAEQRAGIAGVAGPGGGPTVEKTVGAPERAGGVLAPGRGGVGKLAAAGAAARRRGVGRRAA